MVLPFVEIPEARADENWTNSGTGSWFTATNWSGSAVPTGSDNVRITNNGGYATITSGTAAANGLTLGWTGTNGLLVGSGAALNTVSGSIYGGSISILVDDGTWNNTGNLSMSGALTMTVRNGGEMTSGYTEFGDLGGGTRVVVDGTGSTWTVTDELHVSSSSPAWLTIQNGAIMTTTGARTLVGTSGGGRGTVVVDGPGSLWSHSGSLQVSGSSSMSIINSGSVSSQNGVIGWRAGVTVSGTGSNWTNTDRLVIRDRGALTIADGGTVINAHGYVGPQSGDDVFNVLITGTGSSWTNTIDLELGIGDARVIVADGGALNVGMAGSGTVQMSEYRSGADPSARSILQIGDGGRAGTVNAVEIAGGTGYGDVVFNHNDNVTFLPRISGDLGVVFQGGGTTVLAAENTYTGRTIIDNATVRVGTNAGFGNSLVISATNATFGNTTPGGAAVVSTLTFVESADLNFDMLGPLGSFRFDNLVSFRGATPARATFAGNTSNITFAGGVSFYMGLELARSGTGSQTVTFSGTSGDYSAFTLVVGENIFARFNKTGGANVDADILVEQGGQLAMLANNQFWVDREVTVNGILGMTTSTEQEIWVLSGSGQVAGGSVASALTVHSGTFDGVIANTLMSQNLSLVKSGTGNLLLTNANTYRGGTTINEGTLSTSHANALGGGAVTLNSGGALAPLAYLEVDSLAWNGGHLVLDPASPLRVIDAFTNGGSGGSIVLTIEPTVGDTYTLVQFGQTDFAETDFSLAFINPAVQFNGKFTLTSAMNGELIVKILSATAGGPVIDNGGSTGVPTTANFVVDNQVTTSGGNNTVQSLAFMDGSSLTVFNTLTVTSGNFLVNSGSATVGGPGTTATPGDLTKTGAGLLNLTGTMQVNGNANLNGGGLAVNGQLTANSVNVGQDAYLKGSGLIAGNVVNNGTVAPGNSPGVLTVNGNFTQSSTGTLEIEIGSLSLFDQLLISGNASLAGTLAVVPFDGFVLEYGQQFEFLQAGSVSGSFDQVTAPAGFRGRVLEDDGDLTLVIAPASYTLAAQTQNQENVAEALDGFISATDGDRQEVSIALDQLTAAEYPAAFDAISPAIYESLANTTIELTNGQNLMLTQRLSAVRLGAKGFQSIGMYPVLAHDKDGQSILSGKGEKDILIHAMDTEWGVWVQGNGFFARATNVSDVPNYRYQSGGFLAGVDYAWNENFATGLYGGYQGSYAEYGGQGGSNQINSALFGGYATYSQDGFYADAIVGGGYSSYRVRRPIDFGSIDRTARSTPDGGQFTTYLDLGYDWTVSNFTFGPVIAGQYIYAGIAPFTEGGADSLDLRVDQQNVNSLRTNIGGRIAYTWNVASTVIIIPEGRIFWQHEYLNDSRTIGASLDGGSGPGFGFETAAPGRDSVLATAGVSAQFGEQWNANLYYTANFGRQDFVSHMISAGLEWKFW